VGSALAILLLYPLERVRIERQLSVDVTGSVGPGECRPGRNDDNPSNMNSPLRTMAAESDLLETQVEEIVSNYVPSYLEMDAKHDDTLVAPDSPAGSFEFVPSIKFDAASLGTLSYDDGGSNKEEIPCGNSVERAHHVQSSDSNSTPVVAFGTGASHERDTEPSRSTSGHDFVPTRPHETIAQCLLRLHAEKTLYKGVSQTVTTLTISNAIFFYSLQVIRKWLSSLRQNHEARQLDFRRPLSCFLHRISTTSNMGNSLISSTLAGCINVLLTNPLWVASLRVMEKGKMQQGQNLWSVMYEIVQKEGVSQLWNGTYTSLLLVSNPIIQHFAYEQLRLWLLKSVRKQSHSSSSRNGSCSENSYGGGRSTMSLKAASLTPLEAFVCGALAKTLATVLTYPLQLAQTLLRLQRKNVKSSQSPNTNNAEPGGEIYHEGTFDCLYKQYSSAGIRGLFHGMNAKMLQTVLTSAFTFLTYEQTLTRVSRIYDALGSSNDRHLGQTVN
jgi:adenine nucleotide transporter 17